MPVAEPEEIAPGFHSVASLLVLFSKGDEALPFYFAHGHPPCRCSHIEVGEHESLVRVIRFVMFRLVSFALNCLSEAVSL